MRVEQPVGMLQRAFGGHLGRGQAAAVGGEDAVGREAAFKHGEDGGFEREDFGEAFDGQPGGFGVFLRGDFAVRIDSGLAGRACGDVQVGRGANMAGMGAALGAVLAEIVSDVVGCGAEGFLGDVIDGDGAFIGGPD